MRDNFFKVVAALDALVEGCLIFPIVRSVVMINFAKCMAGLIRDELGKARALVPLLWLLLEGAVMW